MLELENYIELSEIDRDLGAWEQLLHLDLDIILCCKVQPAKPRRIQVAERLDSTHERLQSQCLQLLHVCIESG
eukprot:COSAG02_NODE_1051_length_14956_cov_3.414216_10_plen_73_part_00